MWNLWTTRFTALATFSSTRPLATSCPALPVGVRSRWSCTSMRCDPAAQPASRHHAQPVQPALASASQAQFKHPGTAGRVALRGHSTKASAATHHQNTSHSCMGDLLLNVMRRVEPMLDQIRFCTTARPAHNQRTTSTQPPPATFPTPEASRFTSAPRAASNGQDRLGLHPTA
jgi:hypothetical protein